MDLIKVPVGEYSLAEGASIREIDIDFDERKNYPRPIRMTQYDTHPIIVAHLYYGGVPYAVPAGAAANIRLVKHDGAPVYNPALGLSEDRTTIYFEVTKQMSVSDGESKAIVELVINGLLMGTARFKIFFERNPVQMDDLISSEEFKTMEEYVDQAEDAASRASTSATESEESALRAENAASRASTSATESEESALRAENAASRADEDLRATNESRDLAEKYADIAQQYSGNPAKPTDRGTWEVWNADIQEYEDTGRRSILNYNVTYSSVEDMEADAGKQPTDTIAIISTDVETEENARVYIKNEDGTWHFLTDLSGFQGVGIEKIDYKNSDPSELRHQPGTYDWYTITLTDSRTIDFAVWNGSNGRDGIIGVRNHLVKSYRGGALQLLPIGFELDEPIPQGSKVTLTMRGKMGDGRQRLVVTTNGDMPVPVDLVLNEEDPENSESGFYKGHVTFEWFSDWTEVGFSQVPGEGSADTPITIDWLTLVVGDTSTADWSPSSKDLTDNDILEAVKKVDGAGSGLDADTLDGKHFTDSEILEAVKRVDGSGSGLDADTLDGKDSTAFLQSTLSAVLLAAYPVGAYYWSSSSTSPASLFGGSWTQITGRFVLAAGGGYSVNGTGGVTTHSHGAGTYGAEWTMGGTYNNAGSSTGKAAVINLVYRYENTAWTSNWVSDVLVASSQTPSPASSYHYSVPIMGSSAATNNMPPYIVAYCWRRTA